MYKKNTFKSFKPRSSYEPRRPFTPRQQIYDPLEKEFPRNEAIFANELRVIGENGENLGVLSKSEALSIAKDAELDLILIAGQAKPPVCRIQSWEAFKYQHKKKEKEIKKNAKRIKIKELNIATKIAENDLTRKIEKMKEIIATGDQVKFRIRRKWPTTPEQAIKFKENLLTKINDYCNIISVQEKGKDIFILVKSNVSPNAKNKNKQNPPIEDKVNKE